MVLTVATDPPRNGEGLEMEFEERNNLHQLSPSSWNRFEECPRKYWLSRQGLPRKASMPASMGTAIHNSLEDLCNVDLSGMGSEEENWLPSSAREALEKNWEIEKKLFLNTQRRPRWKSELFPKALDGLFGSLRVLLRKARLDETDLSKVSIGHWKKVQEIVIETESTLVSECGRLMGRLDLLISNLEGGSESWIVADLKTGKPPRGELNENVRRQLLLYRDILKQNRPDHPTVHAEGWYSANQSVHRAKGPPILEEALEAWEGMMPTKEPLEPTPSETSCSFCEWKAWCPSWWNARMDGNLTPGGMFRDEVTLLIRFDEESGAALFERAPPIGNSGDLTKSDHRFGAILKDRALEKMRKMKSSGFEGHLFLGSARVDGKVMHLGDWSEILPWSPLLSSVTHQIQ